MLLGPYRCRLVATPGTFALAVLVGPWAAVVHAVVILAVLARFEPGLRAHQARARARRAAVERALLVARAEQLAGLRAAIRAHQRAHEPRRSRSGARPAGH